MSAFNTPMSALAYITRGNLILCVWNRTYQGWGLPGGKGEEGETPRQTCHRELKEETGLTDCALAEMYDALSVTGTGRHVYVFRVLESRGEAKQIELDSPVEWHTKEELLATSPFREFYEGMFNAIRI